MTTFETPYGTVDAPNLAAAQKWIATKKPPVAASPPDRMAENREAAAPETAAGGMSAEANPFGGESGLGDVWQRLVSGMGGKDVSRVGRVGMGIADPFYGAAQIGSRMMAQAGQGVPEQAALPPATTDPVKAIDTAVQQREAGYQQREKEAGLSGGLDTEWARLLGNVAGTAPLAAIPGGAATIPGRVGMAALGGAAGSGAMPVTGGDFGAEKAKQIGLGAAGGAALGGAAEGVGAVLGRVEREVMPPRAPQPPGPMPPAVQQQVQERFQRSAPMSSAGIRDAPAIAEQQANRVSAVQSIIAEKPNLSFDTPKGTVSGRLPQTRQELAEAFSQVKNKLFQKWDAMTEKTEAGVPPGLTSPINKFREAFYAASSKIETETQNLERAKFKLAAELASPSGEKTGSVRTAANALHKAEDKLKAAENERVAASREMVKPWVDLKPISSELERFSADPGLKITPGSEGIISYAEKQAARYGEEEAASPRAVQKAITNANKSLESFYKNPGYESAARAGVDAMIANNLRRGLDETISKVTGPGYQQLKLQYGAMAGAERDVVRSAIKAMGNTPESKFVEGLTNVGTAEELVRGLTSMSLEPAMRGVIVRSGLWLKQKLASPDREVRLMFQEAERGGRQFVRPPALSIGFAGTAGGEGADNRLRQRPSVHRVTPPPGP